MSQPKAFKGKDKRKRPLHLATIALVAGIAVVAWGFSGCSAARQPAPQGARMRSSRMYEDGSVKQAAGATRQALLRGTAGVSTNT